jgi:predicted restriction endonuclease
MVREDARKKLNPSSKECLICGYNKYVECCHIKPVQDFPETALLSEVNALTNICWLCPNHHKELDKQIMDIQLVKDKLNAKLMGEPRNDRDSSAYETVKMPHLPSPN